MTILDPVLWLAAGWVVPTGLRRAGASSSVVSLLSPVALLASFWPPAAAAWFGVTLYVFLIGLGRLRKGEPLLTAGMLYLPVGGFWWLAYKWGWQPLGFAGLIVGLTGIHFHYAGFAAPVLTGLLARSKPVPTPVQLIVLVGPALVGLGIAFSRPLETFAAWLLGAALAWVGWLGWSVSRPGSVCIWLSMGLAATYALGRLTGLETVPLEWMIPTHGLLNVGFVVSYLQSPSSTNGAQ